MTTNTHAAAAPCARRQEILARVLGMLLSHGLTVRDVEQFEALGGVSLEDVNGGFTGAVARVVMQSGVDGMALAEVSRALHRPSSQVNPLLQRLGRRGVLVRCKRAGSEQRWFGTQAWADAWGLLCDADMAAARQRREARDAAAKARALARQAEREAAKAKPARGRRAKPVPNVPALPVRGAVEAPVHIPQRADEAPVQVVMPDGVRITREPRRLGRYEVDPATVQGGFMAEWRARRAAAAQNSEAAA